MKRSYYDLLGVPPNAPAEALQQAYRDLIARAARTPEDEHLADRVRLARRAFAELMHPGKRAAYDARLAREAKPEHFQRETAPYVPDRFRHDAESRGGKLAWAMVITVLVLAGIGVYARQLADDHREARAQQAAEEEARAEARRKAEVLRARVEAPPQGTAAPAEGPGEPGR